MIYDLSAMSAPAMAEISIHFTWVDWAVVAFYMILTTVIGHRLSGKQSTIRDFFLGGKTLPWWAVSGSILATEISALTFIGVPGMVFAAKGDWTYLQWGVGSIVARFIVGYLLVPKYFEEEIYSPYDYMGNKLGEGVRRLVTGLFSLGAILGQSVRVLVTAMILDTVTPMPMEWCIVVIGIFAVAWTLMGGMQTVIWTDVVQFVILLLGGLVALVFLFKEVGWDAVWQINQDPLLTGGVDKTRIFNFALPWDEPTLAFTFWVGAIAMPFQNLAAFGTDQLNAQRMFCCGNAKDARKAMVWSSVSMGITLLMLTVGSGLFAWYVEKGITPDEAAKFAENPDYVFPVWITTILPMGVSGMVLAGAFAAAISSLDSVLASLSQTSLSIWYGREKAENPETGGMVAKSRILVVVWATILSGVALLLAVAQKGEDSKSLITLAFGMVSYTYGALLGVLLVAILPGRRSVNGLMVGVAVSIFAVAWIRPELPMLLQAIGLGGAADWLNAKAPELAFPWFFPINALLVYGMSLLPLGRERRG